MKAVPVEKIEELIRKWQDHIENKRFHCADCHHLLAENTYELSALAAAAVDVPVEAQGTAGLVEQIKTDIVAMAHAEERIQFLEAVLYAVRGCAGTCQKCKDLIATVDAQGRSSVEAQGKPDAPEEKAWLIERRQHGPVEYLTGETSGYFPSWDADSILAIRFCRRKDAERIAGIFDDLDIHICEHAWGLYKPDARPVTDEQKRECIRWLTSHLDSITYLTTRACKSEAEEIVTHILNQLAPPERKQP